MPSGSITITPGKQLIAGERITNTKLNQGFAPTGRIDALSVGTRELIPTEVKTISLGAGSMSFSAVISRVVTLSYGISSFAAFEAKTYTVPFLGAPSVFDPTSPIAMPPTLIVTGTLVSAALSMSIQPSAAYDFVEVVLRNGSSAVFTPTSATPPARLRITMLNFAP